jgi:hypothetical protein
MEKAKLLFRSMLAQKSDMYDYLTSEIKRGGYYYRMICEIFNINSITITVNDKKISVESSDKIILFQDDSVLLISK